MMNTAIFELNEKIVKDINESGVPVAAVYFVLKNILKDAEKQMAEAIIYERKEVVENVISENSVEE